jgi:hypothetical protein
LVRKSKPTRTSVFVPVDGGERVCIYFAHISELRQVEGMQGEPKTRLTMTNGNTYLLDGDAGEWRATLLRWSKEEEF